MYSQFMMHGQKNIKLVTDVSEQPAWHLKVGPVSCP